MPAERRIDVNFPGIAIVLLHHEFRGIPLKTMAFFLPERRKVLSTREGFREAEVVAENFCPPRLSLIHI